MGDEITPLSCLRIIFKETLKLSDSPNTVGGAGQPLRQPNLAKPVPNKG